LDPERQSPSHVNHRATFGADGKEDSGETKSEEEKPGDKYHYK
jgi:hypothetical protein